MIVVYERVSTDGQDLARQAVQRERARADHPGAEIIVLQDDGKSAYHHPIFERPAGKRLCDLIEAGEVEALYADAQDRLSRGKVVEWAVFADLCHQAGTTIVIDGRPIDPESEADEILGVVKALAARRESAEKAHRSRGAVRQAMNAGRYLGGPAPFGYESEGEKETRRLVINPSEARTILQMVAWYEQGAGYVEIADRLNREGVPSPAGGMWERSEVANIIRSPITAGYVRRRTRDAAGRLQGQEIFPGAHEAIIDPERWQRLQEIRLSRRGKGRRPNGGHVFVGGILRCPECRNSLRPRTTPKGYAYYECRTRRCPQSAINARVVEKLILQGLLDLIFDPEETRARIEAAADDERGRADRMIAAAEKRVRAVDKKRARAQADYLDEKLSAPLYKKASATLDKEEAQAQAHAAELREAAQVAQAEAEDLDAEREVVARLERLQEIIRDGGPEERTIIREAISSTFERVFLAEGDDDGALVVIPQLRREAVSGTHDHLVIAAGHDHGRAEEPRRIPLPASLTRERAGRCSHLCSGEETRERAGS
jgi:site-specific DNA recombinase